MPAPFCVGLKYSVRKTLVAGMPAAVSAVASRANFAGSAVSRPASWSLSSSQVVWRMQLRITVENLRSFAPTEIRTASTDRLPIRLASWRELRAAAARASGSEGSSMPSYGSRMPPWPSGPLTENVKDGDVAADRPRDPVHILVDQQVLRLDADPGRGERVDAGPARDPFHVST